MDRGCLPGLFFFALRRPAHDNSEPRPWPAFPLLRDKPPTIAICGEVTSLHEDDLTQIADQLSPSEMQRVAIGLLEVTQAHRLLGITHPDIAERIGERRRRPVARTRAARSAGRSRRRRRPRR